MEPVLNIRIQDFIPELKKENQPVKPRKCKAFLSFIDRTSPILRKKRKASMEYQPPAATSIIFNPADSEQEIRSFKIYSAYIAAYPPNPQTPPTNFWVFVFRVNLIDTIQVALRELNEYTELSDTYIECSIGPPVSMNGRLTDMAKTFKISVKKDACIGDFLDELVLKNLNKYQLVNGSGKRHWMHRILETATTTFHAADENDAARDYLCQGWDNEFPIRPGEYQNLLKGNWHQLPNMFKPC